MNSIDKILHLRKSYPAAWDGSLKNQAHDALCNNIKIDLIKHFKESKNMINIEIITMGEYEFKNQCECGTVGEFIVTDGLY